MIYLDNAATTNRKPECVIDAVVRAMNSMGNASRGAHENALNAAMTIYGARKKIAAFFNCCSPSNVVFTSNSTEALNIAINGVIEEGDHVITTDLEHNSVLRPLYRLRDEKGVQLSFLEADRQGNVNYDKLIELIRPETKAIVSTHASNLTGNVIDIARVGTFSKEHGLIFIVDASQSAGVIPIDMEKAGIDILCFTGHKAMLGPQGTGGMCVGEGVDVKPLKVGGTGVQSYSQTQPVEMPVRLEAGTLNGHGIAGLSAAVDYINDKGIDVIRAEELALMRRFYEGVKDLPGVVVYGDFTTDDRTAIVTLNIEGIDSNELSDELAMEYGIATRGGAHCAPRMHMALGTNEQGAVRFSFAASNTEAEVDEAVRAIKEIAEYNKK